jgi:rare lipoprotein A
MYKRILFLFFILLSPAVAVIGQQLYHGYATYYGRQAHGKQTASGERINMNDFVAAHRSLPFGTRVKITNKSNNQSIIVRIIDRCSRKKPFHFVDLSYGAAKHLNFLNKGRAQITLQVLDSVLLDKNSDLIKKQYAITTTGNLMDSLELSARNSLFAQSDSSQKFGVLIGTYANKSSSYLKSKRFSAYHHVQTMVIGKEYKKRKFYQVVVVGFANFEVAEKYRLEIIQKIRGAQVTRYS